ncbi:MAG: LamG-like jellyroll fold domain-containing protein [Thermoguttaceae bacterium]
MTRSQTTLLLSLSLLLFTPRARASAPIAHWTFDRPEAGSWPDRSGRGHDAAPQQSAGTVEPFAGLLQGAVRLQGQHRLAAAPHDDFATLRHVTFSVWIRPERFDRYNEIFRKDDGENRLLFAFQENGSLLSLGLNVGGYAECDAAIDPAMLLDGLWHHCAATFDGNTMRVYLDGLQVGSLPRSGSIAAGGPAPACIGSSNGGECFQGAIDELQIYPAALDAEQLGTLGAPGRDAQADQILRHEAALARIYVRLGSFAQSLGHARKRVTHEHAPFDAALAAAMARRVSADFPDELRRFTAATALTPAAYVQGDEAHVHRLPLQRLLPLMTEYRPLTDDQRSRMTEDDRRGWAEVDALEAEARQLLAAGDAAADSPRWIDLILAAAARIQFRPFEREAVAPYVPPATPPTRTRSPAEADEILRRDWLHQADGHPTAQRILHEIAWARALAARIAAAEAGPLDFRSQLEQLDGLEQRARALKGEDTELYFAVRQVKRAITLANPVLDFDRILMVDMPFPQGNEWRHETRHRLGYMAVPGGKLVILQGLGPDGQVRQLMPREPLHGSFWRPDVSYDGRKVLFCFKPHNEKAFHLYEIGADGSGLTQLTDGTYDDFDPVYLPDEKHILFSTTRGHTYVRCMPPTNAFVLARADRDGGRIYLVSRNNEPDYLPSVMDDGRIVYTRWEYTDKPLWRAQKLWTVNPDGSAVATFWGNQSVWPDLMKDARNIPGTRRVMFTGSAHHDWFAGSVGIIDPDGGYNFPNGLTKVTADIAWPECGNGPVDPIESPNYHPAGQYQAYYSPCPLGEHDFLVSAERAGKFVLYLMDVDGNRELVYEGSNHIFHALPLRPRIRPPLIADRVQWPEKPDPKTRLEGVLFSSNVLYGAPDALRGKVRYLRVLNIEPKTYTYWNNRPYLSTGPVVSAVQSEGVKRILGTVPVEADGSVHFRVPAGMALHFQLLDDRHRALQTMRSFTGTMPGERRGCLGCHESHSATPDLPTADAIALSKDPRTIEPPPWNDDTVSYDRYVRPVLDRYCGECHQGQGEGRKTFDQTPRTGFLDFDETYLTLIGRPTWGAAYRRPENPPPGFGIANTLMVEAYEKVDPVAYRTPEPMKQLSYNSRLIEIASGGLHHQVRVDPVSLQRLIVWVDTMCPYLGHEEVRSIDDPEFQGIDWLAIRPRIKTAPEIVRPGPVN